MSEFKHTPLDEIPKASSCEDTTLIPTNLYLLWLNLDLRETTPDI